MNVATVARTTMAGCLAGLMLCGVCLALPAGGSVSSVLTPAVAQAKSASTVKNGLFNLSVSKLQSRLGAAFNGLHDAAGELYTTKMVRDSDSGSLSLYINKGSKAMACAMFTLSDRDKYWVAYSDRDKSGSFDMVTVIFANGSDREECIAYTSLALIMALDPSLDSDEVMSLAYGLPEDFRYEGDLGYGRARKNGIVYTLMDSDGTWAFCADCS